MDLLRPGAMDWDAFRIGIMSPERDRREAAFDAATDLAAEAGTSRTMARSMALLERVFLDEAWEAMTSRLDSVEVHGDRRIGFLPFCPITTLTDGMSPNRLADPAAVISDAPTSLEVGAALLAEEPRRLERVVELALEVVARVYDYELSAGRRPDSPGNRVLFVPMPRHPWPSVGFERRTFQAYANTLEMRAMSDLTTAREALALTVKVAGGQRSADQQTGVANAAADARTWALWDLFRRPPNPMDPTMMLWGLGYAPIRILAEGIVIGVPWDEHLDPLVTAPTWEALAAATQRRWRLTGYELGSRRGLRWP